MTVNPFHTTPPEQKLAEFKHSQAEHQRIHDEEERQDRRGRIMALILLVAALGVLVYVGVIQGGMPELECDDRGSQIPAGHSSLTTWGTCHVVGK